MTQKSFVMYHSFEKQFSLLTMEQRGALITAIFNYNKSGEVGVELDPISEMAFSCMRDTFDRDKQAYAEMCERNRENGKKGGRPRNDYSYKTEGFFEKTKKAYNDKDSDMDSDVDSDNDNDNKNDNENNSDNEDKDDKDNINTYQRFYPDAVPANLSSEQEEKEIEGLISEGVPRRYIEERLDRARDIACEKGVTLRNLLRLWWHNDRGLWRPSASAPRQTAERDAKHRELEEWFNARVESIFGE